MSEFLSRASARAATPGLELEITGETSSSVVLTVGGHMARHIDKVTERKTIFIFDIGFYALFIGMLKETLTITF